MVDVGESADGSDSDASDSDGSDSHDSDGSESDCDFDPDGADLSGGRGGEPSASGLSALRHHLPAIAIAVAAAAASHLHLYGRSRSHGVGVGVGIGIGVGVGVGRPSLNVPSPRPTAAPFPRPSKTRKADDWKPPPAAQQEEEVHRYRRTDGLRFCDGDGDGDGDIADDGSLRPFGFRLPAGPAAALVALYAADAARQDGDGSLDLDALLRSALPHAEAPRTKEDLLRRLSADASAAGEGGELPCLLELLQQSSKGSLRGHSVAYVRPPIETYYRTAAAAEADDDGGPEKPSVRAILQQRREEHAKENPNQASRLLKDQKGGAFPGQEVGGTGVKAASVSFTGYAAKFTNLSPHPVELYWDGGRAGGSVSQPRPVGLIQPMDSLGTAVSGPGQSFSVVAEEYAGLLRAAKRDRTASPDRDRYVMKRWVMTADEPHAYYDPIGEGLDGRDRNAVLTAEQAIRYDLWMLNRAYARDYLVATRRPWLADFPRPPPPHPMHAADRFGQTHKVRSWERRFVMDPDPDPRKGLKGLVHSSYEDRATREREGGRSPGEDLVLPEHREELGGGKEPLELTLAAVSCAPRVFRVDNFLSDVEARHLIGLARDGSRNVTVMDQSTVQSGGPSSAVTTDRSARSSSNAWIEREASPIVDAIYRRAADVLGIDESLMRHRTAEEHPELATDHSIAEQMQLVHYGVGERYTPHHDFTYPASGNRYQPGRFATMLLYLNDVEEGGETVFPRAISAEHHDGISIEPSKGTAVLFYSQLPDGNFDDLSQHQSQSVVQGEKWMANLWIWSPIID